MSKMQTQNETIYESLLPIENRRARLGVLGGLLATVLLAVGTQKVTKNPHQQEREVFPRYALIIPHPLIADEKDVINNLEEKVSDAQIEEKSGVTNGETVSRSCFYDAPVKREISNSGIELIKKFEGFGDKEYLCPAGERTIDYGHVIQKGEKFRRINEAEGERLLRKDLKEVESAINDYVKVFLTQRQYDIVCSFVLNIGVEGFRESTFLKKLNKNDYSGAAAQFPRWKYVDITPKGAKKKVYEVSKGLESRRAEERRRFLGS